MTPKNHYQKIIIFISLWMVVNCETKTISGNYDKSHDDNLLIHSKDTQPDRKKAIHHLPQKNYDQELQLLVDEFGEVKVLEAFYFLKINREAFKEVVNDEEGVLVNSNTLSELKKETYELLLLKIDDDICKSSIKDKLIFKVRNWCISDRIFKSVYIFDTTNSYSLEEFVCTTKEIKHLCKKYLTHPSQYWGSLEVEQSVELYYDTLEYLTTLSLEEQRKVYIKLFNFLGSAVRD